MSTDTHRIRVADGTSIPVVGFGTLPGDHTVMYAPKLAHNILSVDALDAKGYSTLFADGIGKVFNRNTRQVILCIPRDPTTRLYTLTQKLFEEAFRLPHQTGYVRSVYS